jgi:hypothetical protein
MIVGCYSMDLYCDGSPCVTTRAYQNQFTGETASECRKEARRIGWRFDLTARKAYCPACNRSNDR